MLDRQFYSVDPADRWSSTSPQHIDWASLMRMFPADFFSSVFTVVRHPVGRALSAYRYLSEVEGVIPEGQGFGDWLREETEARKTSPHKSDNHSRPQVDFLPPPGTRDCAVFHLEHGLDAVIPYFDQLAGDSGGPRAMSHDRPGIVRGAAQPRKQEAVTLSQDDIDLVAQVYAEDFAQLGYEPDRSAPLAPPPTLDPEFLSHSADARARNARLMSRLATRVRRRVQKWSD